MQYYIIILHNNFTFSEVAQTLKTSSRQGFHRLWASHHPKLRRLWGRPCFWVDWFIHWRSMEIIQKLDEIGRNLHSSGHLSESWLAVCRVSGWTYCRASHTGDALWVGGVRGCKLKSLCWQHRFEQGWYYRECYWRTDRARSRRPDCLTACIPHFLLLAPCCL